MKRGDQEKKLFCRPHSWSLRELVPRENYKINQEWGPPPLKPMMTTAPELQAKKWGNRRRESN